MTRFFVPAAAALCLVIAGCSSDEQKSTAESSASGEASQGQEFPNLATVPNEPPPSTPKVEREKLVQGLLADRANAEYTGESLGEETANVPPAAPPPPAPPAPESEAQASEGTGDESAESTADESVDEAAPPVPTEVAALPADLGQPTALIYFAGDTAALTDHDRAILGDVASKYKGERGSRVRIIGHASLAERSGGGAGSDLALARADAVAKTLIGMGVPADALETSTGGATYDESQPTGVAANRRVAIYIGS